MHSPSMVTSILCWRIMVLAAVLAANVLHCPANAAPEPITITDCQVISEPGAYQLVNNLPGPAGLLDDIDCLVVAANDVTIDLGGFVIEGGSLPDPGLRGRGISDRR